MTYEWLVRYKQHNNAAGEYIRENQLKSSVCIAIPILNVFNHATKRNETKQKQKNTQHII